jgi:hypothetical protein
MPFLAYIDPGSGSMLLQVVLAGLLAVPFFFRRTVADVWHRVRGNGDDVADARKPAEAPEESDPRR